MEQIESLALKQSIHDLYLHQIWPRKGESTKRHRIRYFLTLGISAPCWIGVVLHIIVVVKNKIDVDISEDIAVSSSFIGLHFMLVAFVLGNKKIRDLYRRLSDFEKFGRPDNFDKRCKRLNIYSKAYSLYILFGMTLYMVLKQVKIPECRQMNREKNLNENCGMFFPFWVPFKIDYFPMRQLVVTMQYFSIFIIMKGGAALSFTTFEVAECIVLRMKHLCRLLTKAFDPRDDDKKRIRLTQCIEYHIHIIKLQRLFDSVYRYCNAGYVLMAGIIIAALANQYLRDRSLGALIHISGWIYSFFICCHAGQIIFSESINIGLAAVNSLWYEAPVELQKDLMVLIAVAQRGLHLHAIPIGVMSYDLYVALVKTSYSYFTVMNQRDK